MAVAPARTKGLVNAVLRKVSQASRDWPDEATRLSYPDWIVDRLTQDLGADAAIGALESMNESASVVERDDGYLQDLASQWVTETVCAEPGERVIDLCAGPGGKATGLAATGAGGGRPRAASGPGRAGGRQRPAARLAAPAGRRRRRLPSAAATRAGRAGPGRRAVLGPRLVPSPARRPLADRARRRRPPGDVATGSAGRGRAAAPPRRRARLLGVHPHRGRDAGRRPVADRDPSRPRRPRARRRRTGAVGAWPTAEACWCCPRPPAPTACSCCGWVGSLTP